MLTETENDYKAKVAGLQEHNEELEKVRLNTFARKNVLGSWYLWYVCLQLCREHERLMQHKDSEVTQLQVCSWSEL